MPKPKTPPKRKAKKTNGWWPIGARVSYRYFSAAISCQSSHEIKGRAKIESRSYSDGRRLYCLDDGRNVFDREIISVNP